MFFASAAFLAGLTLLSIPWWLHRLNAHSADQHTFSSLFLMRPSEAPVNMRRRLQHLALLALRWLLLIACCTAFSEPIIELAGAPKTAEESEPHRLIVLDSSLSMNALVGGERAFDAARKEARSLIARLPAGVKAAIVTAADELELVVPLTEGKSRLRGAVTALETSAARLALDGLMRRIAILGDTMAAPGERLQIHLISDFQASGMPDQFNALINGSVWPVTLHPVGTDDAPPANRAVSNLHATEDGSLEVGIRSLSAPGETIEVVLYQNNATVGRQSLFVPENGYASTTFTLPESPLRAGRDRGGVTWTAELESADALSDDNVRRLVRRVADRTELPVLAESERAYAYLRAAVQAAAPRFVPERVSELEDLSVPVVAVLDPGVLTAGASRILRRHLESGGAALMTVGPQSRSAGRLPLIDVQLAANRFEQTPHGVMALDRSHPALTGFSGLQDLTFFQAVRIDDEADDPNAYGEVILALDDGTPMLTEYRIGAGRLMLLSTALDPAWSTLVVRPAIVGFMANILGYLAEDLLPSEVLVGQPMSIPAQSVQIFSESGERVLGLADTVGRPTVSLARPGIYQLRTPSSSRLLAVNTDLAESDLSPAPADLLARWQGASQRVSPAAAATPVETDLTLPDRAVYELPLAPWLLALLALLIFMEPLFANTFSGRKGNRTRSDARPTMAVAS